MQRYFLTGENIAFFVLEVQTSPVAREQPMSATEGDAGQLPEVTHLQFLVLDVIAAIQETSATELRRHLEAFSTDQKGPKFYQLMGRLEKSGFVESWAQQYDVGGGSVSRTFYKLTEEGETARQITLEFYNSRLKLHAVVTERLKRSHERRRKQR